MSRRLALGSTSIFEMGGPRAPRDGYLLLDGERIEGVVDRSWAATEQPGWEIREFGNQTIVPGFVDPHVHIEHTANAVYGAVDCHTPPNADIDQLIATLSDNIHLKDVRGGWLVGQGGLFADRRFADGRLPNRTDLDRVSTTVPIAVRFGFHVTVLNTVGLERALEAGLQETDGGHIIYGDDGAPTGVIHELYHMLPIPQFSKAELDEAIEQTVANQLTAHGVTTFGEITNTARDLESLDSLIASGRVRQEVHAFLWAPGTRDLTRAFDADNFDDLGIGAPRSLRIAGVKVFADGGFSAAGAAILQPYASGSLRKQHPMGSLAFTDDEMVGLIRRADETGLQLIAHSNGERAQRQICEASVIARANTNGPVRPVRLEHGGNVVTDWDTLTYWEKAAIVPVAQAGFIYTMGSYIPEYLGAYSQSGMFPFASLRRRGWRLASSSDGAASEMAQFNPMFSVGRAMDRRGYAGDIVNPTEAIELVDALDMHTSASAEALGLGHDRGRLAPGLRADVAVLSHDIRSMALESSGDVTASHVFIGGAHVHGN